MIGFFFVIKIKKLGVIIMKIENLKEGMVIKNYKELCGLLEINPIGGNAKKAQLVELKRFCDFSKQGYKFIINKIYIEPKAKKSSGNNSKYIKEIGDILVEYLYQDCKHTSYHKVLPLGRIIEILGMANETYGIGNRHKKELSEALQVNIIGVYYFYNNTRNEFKRIIDRALNNLKSRRVLNWHKSIVIGKTSKAKGIEYVAADEEEEREIINMEKETLKYMGLKDVRDLFLKGKTKEFQNIMKKELPPEWKYYFYAYNLNIGDRAIEIEHESIQEKRLSLNDKMKDRASKRLKIYDKKQDEQKLIDKLIDLLQYDLNLDDEIIQRYKEHFAKKEKAIYEKQVKLDSLEKEKEAISDEIKLIEDSDQCEIDMVEYIRYADDLKEKQIYKDLEVLFS